MGLYRGGAARQFVLQIAEDSAMVYGQHWLPSHSSPQFANSQLQFGTVPQGTSDVPGGQTDWLVLQPEVVELPALG